MKIYGIIKITLAPHIACPEFQSHFKIGVPMDPEGLIFACSMLAALLGFMALSGAVARKHGVLILGVASVVVLFLTPWFVFPKGTPATMKEVPDAGQYAILMMWGGYIFGFGLILIALRIAFNRSEAEAES